MAMMLAGFVFYFVLCLTGADQYDFSKDQDLVIVLDQSQSIGQADFARAVTFLRTLIEASMVIHPRYTRLALLTFVGNFSVEFDHISSDSYREGGCELFGPGGAWNMVKWKEGQNGRDLSGPLQKARSIFQVGKLARPSVKQLLMLVGDGEWFDGQSYLQQSKLELKILQDEGVKVYGVGLGNSLKQDVFKSLVSIPDTYYYQDLSTWEMLILDKKVLPQNGVYLSGSNTLFHIHNFTVLKGKIYVCFPYLYII